MPEKASRSLDLRWRQKEGGPLLFVVHGYGEHPAAALVLGTILDPEMQCRLCAPSGGIDLGDDRRSFYRVDFQARRLEPTSFTTALIGINDALDEACQVNGTRREDAVLAGFSQGAGLALAMSLGAGDRPPPAAVMVFSGIFYDEDQMDWDLDRERHPEIFWAHGNRDEIFTVDRHRSAVEHLKGSGVNVATQEVDAGHVLTPGALGAGREWLGRRLQHLSERPV